MIQSIMPVAVYSVVSSILFELDSRLASGMFVVNTALFLVLVLPLLMLGGGAIFAVL
jgi:predicted permease